MLGVLSLIVWTLLLIVTLKYVLVLLRADNKGEGGMFALMALGQSVAKRSAPADPGARHRRRVVLLRRRRHHAGHLGAVGGRRPEARRARVRATWCCRSRSSSSSALFAVQSRGTAKVAQFFGPITLVWFVVLAVGGLVHIVDDPRVLARAQSAATASSSSLTHGLIGLTVLGLVFLAVTGAEALYADLGHFGRKPIQVAWLALVLPALILNYFGQGALLLANPEAIENPFYLLYPEWALIPMVILATVATVIASQAVITGAFSFTRQAIQLGLLPRFAIRTRPRAWPGRSICRASTSCCSSASLLVVLAVPQLAAISPPPTACP